MSRDQLQDKEVDATQNTAGLDLDVDSEHKPDVARRASNASLGRAAVQMKADTAVQHKHEKHEPTAEEKKTAHEGADIDSRTAISSSLKLLAKHMFEGGPRIRDLANRDAADEAGKVPDAQEIVQIFDRIQSEAAHASMLLSTNLSPDIKRYLIPEVQLVLGAYTRFAPHIPLQGKANKLIVSQTGQGERNPNWIQQELDGFSAKVGAEAKLDPISTAPKETEEQLRSTAITDHIDGATKAAASVNTGNTTDTARVAFHVNELTALTRHSPGAIKAHKGELKALTTTLKALEKTHPDVKSAIDPLFDTLKALH